MIYDWKIDKNRDTNIGQRKARFNNGEETKKSGKQGFETINIEAKVSFETKEGGRLEARHFRLLQVPAMKYHIYHSIEQEKLY